MKKVVLTLVALVAMAGLVFAAAPEFKPSVSISGNASMTFGFDLDTGAFGIANAKTSGISLTLVPKGSDEKGGEGDVYGWIKLADYEITSVLTAPGVSAKLFLGPVFIDILGTSDAIDYAAHGAGVAKGYNILTASVTNVANDLATEYEGFTIGLKDASVVSLEVGVKSNYDWTGAAASLNDSDNNDSGWVFFAKVGLNVAPLSVSLGANFGTDAYDATPVDLADELGVGGKVELNVDLGGGLALKPAVAFDLKSVPAAGATTGYSDWQLGAGLRLAFPGSKLEQFGDIEPGFHTAFSMGSTGAAGSAVTLDTMDLTFAFADGDIIPVLNVGVIFELADLGNDVDAVGDDLDGDMAVGIYAGASIDGGITAWGKFSLKDLDGTSVAGTNVSTGIQPDVMNLEIGVELKVVTNTAFTLKYVSGNLSNNFAYASNAVTPAAIKLGAITFETKITY